MNSNHHEGALLEDINSTFDAVTELVVSMASDMKALKDDVSSLKSDVSEIKGDVKAVKAVVTDQTRELHRVDHQVGDHEGRLHTLEQAA